MRNRCVAVTIFLMVALGCRSGPRRVIVAIPLATADSMFVTEHAGLIHEAAPHSLSIYWNGPGGEGNVLRQVELAERAIRENDYGIVISPAARFALNTVIQNAVSHGIPVVVLGPPLELAPGARLSYVSTDIQKTGALAAERIAQTVGEQGEVAVSGIDPMVPGAIDCAHAFESSLLKLAPQVKVVSRMVGSPSSGQSEIAMKRTLQEHPRIGAIYALDLIDIRGAVGAVRDAGKEGKVRIVGNNQSLDMTYRLRHGTVDALLVPDTRAMGAQAVRNLVAVRDGKAAPPRTMFEPALLTRDNIDTEAMQQLLKLDWKPQP